MRIFNFGSINIDKVYQVDEFVRGGETTSARGMESFPGGKGLNQSIAAARAGAQVIHAGAIGADGGYLAELLSSSGVDATPLMTLAESTGHALIQINKEGQNCIIVYGGANHRLTRAYIDEVFAMAQPDDLLLLQNEINEGPYIMECARAKGMQIAFNPSPVTPELMDFPLSLVDYFIVNELEGAALTGKSGFQDILDEMLRRYPHCKVVLTVGSEGSYYQDSQGTLRQDIFRAPVVDTTAAGDTFCGYFLSGVTSGASVADALKYASAAASIAISRKGAAPSIPLMAETAALVSQTAT